MTTQSTLATKVYIHMHSTGKLVFNHVASYIVAVLGNLHLHTARVLAARVVCSTSHFRCTMVAHMKRDIVLLDKLGSHHTPIHYQVAQICRLVKLYAHLLPQVSSQAPVCPHMYTVP